MTLTVLPEPLTHVLTHNHRDRMMAPGRTNAQHPWLRPRTAPGSHLRLCNFLTPSIRTRVKDDLAIFSSGKRVDEARPHSKPPVRIKWALPAN